MTAVNKIGFVEPELICAEYKALEAPVPIPRVKSDEEVNYFANVFKSASTPLAF